MAVPRSSRLLSQRFPRPLFHRSFHTARRLAVVKPFLLADIGEGITECQLIQWFVQPGARVEQFEKICEVQSDKASVEITSPFDGVIKKLHYEPDDMAKTGKPLVDIDIQGEISEADEEKLGGTGGHGGEEGEGEAMDAEARVREQEDLAEREVGEDHPKPRMPAGGRDHRQEERRGDREKRTLATPAVRHLTKELDVDIADVKGTGKDGRVLKEDVHRYVEEREEGQKHYSSAGAGLTTSTASALSHEDRKVPLSPVQSQMFKTMTRSLTIPHFLYTSTADLTCLTDLRKRLNASAKSSGQKLTHLPFIIKAVSLALQHHSVLNAALNVKDPKKPELTHKGTHNIGIAIDSPSGLLVPVVKSVQDLSITDISSALRSLSQNARENKLSPSDFSGATFTISNIGSIGGGVVSPVISEPQVAILGVGRSKVVPAFDKNEVLVRREELILSWSADHRVVDGAECARCAERVRGYLEEPGLMMAGMR